MRSVRVSGHTAGIGGVENCHDVQLVHVSCARFADVGKGNEKIRLDRGGQHHRRKASRTGGADG